MSADPRVEAVAEALDRPGPYLNCTHPNAEGFYQGPCAMCDAVAVLAALDAYDETALRERIAAEIEALGECIACYVEGQPCLLHDAARIARGTT